MFVEALVITTCLQQKGGCNESYSAYYKTSKELQAISDNIDSFGKKITNNHKWLVYTITPIYAVAADKQANFYIYSGITLGFNFKKEIITIQWSY